MIARAAALILLAGLVVTACATDGHPRSSDVLQLENCRERASDSFHLGNLAIQDDELTIHIATGGGCTEHSFAICWDHAVFDSNPPQTSLRLFHDAHGDSCDAFLTLDVRVDVSPIRATYGPPMVLHVTGAVAQLAGTTNSALLQ